MENTMIKLIKKLKKENGIKLKSESDMIELFHNNGGLMYSDNTHILENIETKDDLLKLFVGDFYYSDDSERVVLV